MDEDRIRPRIEHDVDLMIDEETDELIFYYNYLDYRFDTPRGEVRARTYTDGISEVAIQRSPPLGEDELWSDAFPDVAAYLRRRFARLSLLGPGGYVEIAPDDP